MIRFCFQRLGNSALNLRVKITPGITNVCTMSKISHRTKSTGNLGKPCPKGTQLNSNVSCHDHSLQYLWLWSKRLSFSWNVYYIQCSGWMQHAFHSFGLFCLIIMKTITKRLSFLHCFSIVYRNILTYRLSRTDSFISSVTVLCWPL